MKGADFGKAIGIDRPANVKDKIKKWQLELNAEPEAADAASPVESKPPPSPTPPKPPTTPKAKPAQEKPTPKATHTPAKSVDVEATPERPKSAKKQPPVHNKLDDDVAIATAPKKRVVSDSHWRNKNSPPKPSPKATSPKQLPTGWVRPAARKAAEKAAAEKAAEKIDKPEKPEKPEPKTSPPLQPNPLALLFNPNSAGQRIRAQQRQRRLSRPASTGNAERPTTSGSGSGENAKDVEEESQTQTPQAKEKGKVEIVRVRRRPRARTSPRGSLSAEDVTLTKPSHMRSSDTTLSEAPANVVTVEYDQSEVSRPSYDEMRERRRKSRRKPYSDVSGGTSPERTAMDKRKSERKSLSKEAQDTATRPSAKSAPTTPKTPVTPSTSPQKLGSRLEMWLQATPDPFADTDSPRRRKSKDSVSTLELPPKGDKSDVSASTEEKSSLVEDTPPARSSNSRRRRRKRSSPARLDPKKEAEADGSEVSLSEAGESTPAEPTSTETAGELTPTPTLKRRGARRAQQSPTKERSMSLPSNELPNMEADDASTAPSSSVESQTLKLDQISLPPPQENPAMRRLFPSTGKRLSTIVSVDSFATKMQQNAPSEVAGTEVSDTTIEGSFITERAPASEVLSQLHAETSTIVSRKSTRRKRLASHADLISVLSMPKAGTRSLVSARSIRTNRSRLATATIGDIMNELALDESKYMRELRTLVDGVIPVLLSCVLSKTDSAVAAGLFSRSANSDPSNVTKPIVDMGVSLERLKTLHKRVPKEDPDAFLSWAQSAQRVYTDYIAAWRLGFQDVVISLASADEDPFRPAKVVNGPDDGAPWDEGMPRNAEGYVINGDGERVDVAYMLKRPLVRLKYLTKSIKVSCS